MSFILYELAAADKNVRFSPHCWKIRMALAHKGIEADRKPWHFTEKDEIAFSSQGKVPVLTHDNTVVSDSWAIASYLDKISPNTPLLFNKPESKSLALFLNQWADSTLLLPLARLIIQDIYSNIASCDKDYFRKTREKKFGQKIEDISADREERVWEFRELLSPIRAVLKDQPYLSGDKPSYADYCIFGYFMWARCISDFQLLELDDPINLWRDLLLNAFNGLARKAPRLN